MSFVQAICLAAAAAAGGAINAVAGGGTLVTFPTLLFFGMPAINANATSTLALLVGTSGGIYGYRKHLAPIRNWLWRLLPISLFGGLLGAILLTHTSNKTFSKLVPFLILFATLLFLFQNLITSQVPRERGSKDGSGKSSRGSVCHEPESTADRPDNAQKGIRKTQYATRSRPTLYVSRFTFYIPFLAQFLVALYGGYFGAGIGILMLACLGWIGFKHIHQMNTLKTILSAAINLVAAVWFIVAGLVRWPEAAVMTLGSMAGYFLGSHFSQRIPQKRVRQLITLIGLVLSLLTFYREFIM